jgi:hypothetical protein
VGPNRRPRSAEERRTHLHRRLYLMRKSPTLPYDIQAFGSAERFGNRQWGSTCEMIWPQRISRMQADYRPDILRGIITGRREVGRSCPLQTTTGRRDYPAAPSDTADQRAQSYELVWSTDSWSRATSSSISMRWARQWTAGSPSTFLVCELSSSEKRGRRAGVG